MKKLLAILLLSCPVLVFAKSKHAPLPDGVATAKTVYIVNQAGDQGVTDGAYDAFTKWGRFTVAKNKESAGLIASFTRTDRLIEGTNHPVIDMSIYLPDSDDAIYQTASRVHFRSWAGSGRSCVNDFKKRLQESQP